MRKNIQSEFTGTNPLCF